MNSDITVSLKTQDLRLRPDLFDIAKLQQILKINDNKTCKIC